MSDFRFGGAVLSDLAFEPEGSVSSKTQALGRSTGEKLVGEHLLISSRVAFVSVCMPMYVGETYDDPCPNSVFGKGNYKTLNGLTI